MRNTCTESDGIGDEWISVLSRDLPSPGGIWRRECNAMHDTGSTYDSSSYEARQQSVRRA